MQGNLSEINLNEILALATGGKKSGLLTLRHGNETVELFLNEGEIVHATCPIGEGEKAIYYPVTWGDGRFTLEANGAAPVTTIQKKSEQILEDLRTMSREWESIMEVIPSGHCVFQLADLAGEPNGPITIPHAAWRVLCKIDGRRSVQEVAGALKAPYAQTAKILFNLCKSGLVAVTPPVAQASGNIVSIGLLTRLIAHLTEVMGPIAPFVVRDQIRALSESQEKFPQTKLEELIGLVSREIADAKRRTQFEAAMAREFAHFKNS
jgi:phage FluMu protein gp41